MPAKVIAVGQPINDDERQAISHLRDHLPDDYVIIHNFEIVDNRDIYEIDLAILAPHCVFVVDIKGTQGKVNVYGSQWHPEGRSPFHSPLAKLRNHAKRIKTLIEQASPGTRDLRDIHVQEVVLMTASNAQVVDYSGLDKDRIAYLGKSTAFFKSKTLIPSHRLTNISKYLAIVEKAIRGVAAPSKRVVSFREWVCEDKLGTTDLYDEYKAHHSLQGKSTSKARLRYYRIDPYLPQDQRDQVSLLISNAFRALSRMPPYPNIVAVRDFFPTDDNDGFVLVTEDVNGMALRQHIERSELALTFDQKLRVMRDMLSALDHAHRYGVIHRNLTPEAIIVTPNGNTVLTAFDFARVLNRESSVALEIIDDLDKVYQAPECYGSPANATAQSDLFAVGLIFYQLLTGELPVDSTEAKFEMRNGFYPTPASEQRTDVPEIFDEWLARFYRFEPAERYLAAGDALARLEEITRAQPIATKRVERDDKASNPDQPIDLSDLPKDFLLDGRFIVEGRLGKPGGFGVAYKVFDTYADDNRVIKLVLKDRESTLERLRKEYAVLERLRASTHPNIVRVVWAGVFTNLENTPFLVLEYLNGLTVQEFIDGKALNLFDAKQIALQAGRGLEHLHGTRIYHQDIKPSNLLWTDHGVKIIDFNVAVFGHDPAISGGSRRYVPPDFDTSYAPSEDQLADRDVYALGVTFYQCVTGHYPFGDELPSPGALPIDLNQRPELRSINPRWSAFFLRALAPRRANRFGSIDEFLSELQEIGEPFERTIEVSTSPREWSVEKPNYNPNVAAFLRLYSQSQQSNAETRGLNEISRMLYVETSLDTVLKPAILEHDEFRLVIITGNAGDGKTAFIQQLEAYARENGARFEASANGSRFQLAGRTFQSNYDGSQDEGDKVNDQVLREFFSPYSGRDNTLWSDSETRLIAINEGRLVDFFSHHEQEFPRLARLVFQGLRGDAPEAGIALVNLNLRSVVADSDAGFPSSIMDHLLERIIEPKFWSVCSTCDIANKCYIYHNIQTFSDPVAGSKVRERLKSLYLITHLRNRLHITMRDLRSALSYTLIGTRDCDEIHALYNQGAVSEILDSYYFNSWTGGYRGSTDRLLKLLREIDVGEVSNPDIDRSLGLFQPDDGNVARFSFSERNRYDDAIFTRLHEVLPRTASSQSPSDFFGQHRSLTQMLRRRHFFEWRDPERWREMLPYRTYQRFFALVNGAEPALENALAELLKAINRGEGLSQATLLPQKLALRVYEIPKGTIRSYRLFDAQVFRLERVEIGNTRFLEYVPAGLALHFNSPVGNDAQLEINLDIYEMLGKLNEGYVPSIEEREGYYRSLAVFKNILSSAPYQEVLLTESGYDFYSIRRLDDGVLRFTKIDSKG